MTKRSNLGILLVATSSFIGGVGIGLLLAPGSGKQNRRWVTDHASELAHWVDEKGHDTIAKSEERLRTIRKRMQKGFKDAVPDLYEATEYIDLDNSELAAH